MREEKIHRLNELLQKWNNGDITEEEIIEVAEAFMRIPEHGKTPGFAQKFKEIIDNARISYRETPERGVSMPLELHEGPVGMYIGATDSVSPFSIIGTYNGGKIFSHGEQITFNFRGEGWFEVESDFLVHSEQYNKSVVYSRTIETVDKHGFVQRIVVYSLDGLKDQYGYDTDLDIVMREGTAKYIMSMVYIPDPTKPDRSIKRYVEYKPSRVWPREEEISVTWESIADTRDGLGNASHRSLPNIANAVDILRVSKDMVHTHLGYPDDVIICSDAQLSREELLAQLAKIKDPRKKEILVERLGDRLLDPYDNGNGDDLQDSSGMHI